MDENELRQLLQSNRDQTSRGLRCPDNNELARYISGQFEAHERKNFEAHIAGCKPCLNTIGFLAAAEEWTTNEIVPANLLHRARDLVRSEPTTLWRWRWAMATAAAACIVLVVSLIALRFRAEQQSPPASGPLVAQDHLLDPQLAQPEPTTEVPRPAPTASIQKPKSTVSPAPSLRGGENALKPEVVFPREGALLKREQLQFRWTPMVDALFYELKVATDDGGLVFEGKTNGPQLTLTNDVDLRPAGKYFVTVVAHLSGGRTARSNSVSFRLAR